MVSGMVMYVDTEVPVVTDQDVARLLDPLRPGSMHPASELYEQYAAQMREADRPAVHPTSLGHALSRAGCRRHRVRRTEGGRRNPRHIEYTAWILPEVAGQPFEDSIGALIKTMGPGIFSEDQVMSTYLRLDWKPGWGEPLTRRALMRALTERRIPPMRSAHGNGRYFSGTVV